MPKTSTPELTCYHASDPGYGASGVIALVDENVLPRRALRWNSVQYFKPSVKEAARGWFRALVSADGAVLMGNNTAIERASRVQRAEALVQELGVRQIWTTAKTANAIGETFIGRAHGSRFLDLYCWSELTKAHFYTNLVSTSQIPRPADAKPERPLTHHPWPAGPGRL
jgi:hypothetical protein